MSMLDHDIAYRSTGEKAAGYQAGLWGMVALMIGIILYAATGAVVAPFWVLPLIPLAMFGAYYTLRDASFAFALLTFTITLVQLKPVKGGGMTTYDALAGAIICLLLGGIFYRRIMSYEKYSLNSSEYVLFIIYFFWVTIIGSTNLIFSNLAFAPWFREVLLFSPLLIIPPLFLLIDLKRKRDRNIFYGTMAVLAVLCFIVSVVKVRSSFLAATYLFEASYGGVNLINGPCMLFVFFYLYLSEAGKKKAFYVFGILLAIATIALAHNRTMLVLAPAGLILTPIFLPKGQRKKAITLLIGLTAFLSIVIGILYFSQPFARIILNYFLSHILSSSHLSTDPSLVGRYIEWRHIWKAIESSPIVGYGVGGTYHTYNWFGGYFYDSSYTHNGYLGILQKGGLIGFALLALAYGGFVRKGFVLLRKKMLTGTERAIVRGGLATLLLLIFATNTFNMFAHRDVLLYVGIIWGYFLYLDRSSPTKPAPMIGVQIGLVGVADRRGE